MESRIPIPPFRAWTLEKAGFVATIELIDDELWVTLRNLEGATIEVGHFAKGDFSQATQMLESAIKEQES